jgi:large subunit ribosomal protein L21
MIAVIKTGGKQYTVSEGDTLRVEKLAVEPGKSVSFDEVLLVLKGESDLTLGMPMVKGASVKATVVTHGRAKKVDVRKFKNKTRYFKRYGHRQPYTEVKIETIAAK